MSSAGSLSLQRPLSGIYRASQGDAPNHLPCRDRDEYQRVRQKRYANRRIDDERGATSTFSEFGIVLFERHQVSGQARSYGFVEMDTSAEARSPRAR